MPDAFQAHKLTLESPWVKGFAVTPNDGTDLAFVTRSLWVGGAGDVSVVMDGAGNDTVTFTGVLAGTALPVRATRVRATGTTATGILGLH